MRSSATPPTDREQGPSDWSDEIPSDELLDPDVLDRIRRELERDRPK